MSKHTRSSIANGIQAIAVKGGAGSDGEAGADELSFGLYYVKSVLLTGQHSDRVKLVLLL